MRVVQLIVFAIWPVHAVLLFADDSAALLRQAETKFTQGEFAKAVELTSQVIKDEAASNTAYRLRAAAFEQLGQYERAIADLDAYVARESDSPEVFQRRGELHFKAGNMRESIADFDRFLKSHPDREPHHWQRGISYYYARQYELGVAQFELHKSVNPHDVENAIWHYLCKARVDGVAEARAALIEIHRDGRPWAMTVYRMFQGKVTPQQAIEQAEKVSLTEADRKYNLFYTHLYVGLLHEADGKADDALRHIRIAVEKYPSSHYMGDVARVHLQLARAEED